jgi:hypothetical protein
MTDLILVEREWVLVNFSTPSTGLSGAARAHHTVESAKRLENRKANHTAPTMCCPVLSVLQCR